MRAWLEKLWTDPTYFAQTCRGVIATLGALLAAGKLPLPKDWDWMGLLIVGASGFIAAGQKNPKLGDG